MAASEASAPKRLAIGIDLGTSDSYVGYISGAGVDVVQNEVSQRKTPTLVGFTERERLLGDAALSQIKSNVRNTCRNIKHLLGQRMGSPDIQVEQFWSTCELAEDSTGHAGCRVSYKGEETTFSAVQITAMFLTKLIEITEAWCKGEVAEAVIGVPSYFSDFQRAAVLDAAQIAGLKVLRVMNEHTATALEYGYFRSESFSTEKTRTVAFCMMGHAVFSVAIAQFVKGRLTILCEKSAKVGGRDMDECLLRVFSEQFKKKTGCDVLSNKKALFKLEDAVTKTKKILSANSESSISCECLMEDEDFASRIDRKDFLDMCKPMMAKVHEVLESAKAASCLDPSVVDVVEICGGACRVPWVKEMCSTAFGGKDLSMTMNADECVARGCTIQAAILSNLYKTRDFKVEDFSPFAVSLGWRFPLDAALNGNGEAEKPAASDRCCTVFPQHTFLNFTKVLTFFRKEAFELTAKYAESGAALPDGRTELGTYKVDLPRQAERRKVKVKAHLTVHGTFEISSAQLVEEDPEESGEAPAAPDATVPPATPDAEDDTPSAGKRRASGAAGGPRKRLRRTDLDVTPVGRPGLAAPELERRRADEQRMIAEMREIVERNARRNDLESYILTMRSGVAAGAKFGDYISEADRGRFTAQLHKAEEWLYEHMDEEKQVFVDKLAELKVIGGPVERRFREEERRPDLIAALEKAAQDSRAAIRQAKPKNGDGEKLRSLNMACAEALKWLAEAREKQSKLTRREDPVLDGDVMVARTEEINRLAEAAFEQPREMSIDAMSDGVPPSPLHSDAGELKRRSSVDVD